MTTLSEILTIWSNIIYGTVERGVACDIIVYNEEEFSRDLPINRFLKNILKEGMVLYEKIE